MASTSVRCLAPHAKHASGSAASTWPRAASSCATASCACAPFAETGCCQTCRRLRGCEEGVIKGLYQLQEYKSKAKAPEVQLMGSGTILREVEAAAEMLKNDFVIVLPRKKPREFHSFNGLAMK